MGGMEKGIRGDPGNAKTMIAYLKNDEIDRSRWDDCLAEIPGIRPYAYSWYLDIMSPGWEALVDDDYCSLFPPAARKKVRIQLYCNTRFPSAAGAVHT